MLTITKRNIGWRGEKGGKKNFIRNEWKESVGPSNATCRTILISLLIYYYVVDIVYINTNHIIS